MPPSVPSMSRTLLPWWTAVVLIVLSGLPGTGKTTLARALVAAVGAAHVRIDTIEQALVDSGAATHPVGPQGYYVARAVAADLLRQGHTVVADGVNPLPVTRELWWRVASGAGVGVRDVEVVCSDPALHRARVEHRVADIPGHPEPTWDDLQRNDFVPWTGPRTVVDTAVLEIADAVRLVLG